MARKRLLVAVAALTVVSPLAGCLGAVTSASTHCHATQLVTASWADRDAAQAIGEMDEADAYRPSGGFDVSIPAWESRYGSYAIHAVRWNVSSEVDPVPYQGMNTLVLRASGFVNLQVPADVPDDRVRRLFETFAAEVTEAGAETIEAWADAFVASREDHAAPGEGSSGFHAEIEGPFAVEGIVRDLAETEPTPLGVPGEAVVEEGAWAASFTVAYDRLDNGRSKDAFWTLSGDAFGRTLVELPNVEEDPQAVADRIEEVYDRVGIDADAPEPEALRLDTACVPAELRGPAPR